MTSRLPALSSVIFWAAILALLGVDSTTASLTRARDATPLVTTDAKKYTGCSTCLASSTKKYCITQAAKPGDLPKGACCNKSDFSNTLCNGRLEGVTCSDTIGMETEDGHFLASSKYMVCPKSK